MNDPMQRNLIVLETTTRALRAMLAMEEELTAGSVIAMTVAYGVDDKITAQEAASLLGCDLLTWMHMEFVSQEAKP